MIGWGRESHQCQHPAWPLPGSHCWPGAPGPIESVPGTCVVDLPASHHCRQMYGCSGDSGSSSSQEFYAYWPCSSWEGGIWQRVGSYQHLLKLAIRLHSPCPYYRPSPLWQANTQVQVHTALLWVCWGTFPTPSTRLSTSFNLERKWICWSCSGLRSTKDEFKYVVPLFSHKVNEAIANVYKLSQTWLHGELKSVNDPQYRQSLHCLKIMDNRA